jgi:rhodanese-related sulfurtransferase
MLKEITVEDLKERIDRKDSFVLINVSDNVSVCSMDAIKGTYCIPQSQLLGQIEALFSKAVHFVIYCSTPECAKKAAETLHQHKYTNVEYVNGNLLQWKEKGYPTESLWPAYDWHD